MADQAVGVLVDEGVDPEGRAEDAFVDRHACGHYAHAVSDPRKWRGGSHCTERLALPAKQGSARVRSLSDIILAQVTSRGDIIGGSRYAAGMARWAPGSRQRLQTAALDLFSEQGFENTTVAEIAARAG